MAVVAMAVGLALLGGCGGEDGGDEAEPAEPPEFAYSGASGPAHWGSLDPSFEACASGTEQSPIALEDGRRTRPPRLMLAYEVAMVEATNNGHSVQADLPPGGSIELGGRPYELRQFHFHAPSEHRIDGRSFPLEFHFVHEAEDGELVVLGVVAEQGDENPAFAELAAAVPAEEGGSLAVGKVDPGELLPADAETARRWSYPGSLTTPPCTEGVRWEVFDTPIELSREQIGAYTDAYDDTNRPLQRRDGRPLSVG